MKYEIVAVADEYCHERERYHYQRLGRHIQRESCKEDGEEGHPVARCGYYRQDHGVPDHLRGRDVGSINQE